MSKFSSIVVDAIGRQRYNKPGGEQNKRIYFFILRCYVTSMYLSGKSILYIEKLAYPWIFDEISMDA
jgi:hypothetical protein